MTLSNIEFATKHKLTALPDDVIRLRDQLDQFYKALEDVVPVGSYYVQLIDGENVRSTLWNFETLRGSFGAAIAIVEIPSTWPTQYRASIAYHLAPLLNEAVKS